MADMEQALQKVLDKMLNELNYIPRDVKIKAISSEGANYTSALFTIEVTSPNKDDLRLFAKVGNIGDEVRDSMNADLLFQAERYVYTELMEIYEEIQDEHEISEKNRLIFPKFYGYSAEVGREIIVLENLVESGYRLYNRLESCDWNTARVSVENLSKFHALSFAFEKKYPEKFNKAKDLKFAYATRQDKSVEPYLEQILKEYVAVIKNEEQRKKIKEFLMDGDNLKNFNSPIGRPVICHGDYRLSNLMFKGEGDRLTAKVLDFQTVHGGCPAADLVYFIFLGSDEKFRAQYYEKLVDHYYRSLEEALGRLSIDSVEVYPREKFDSDMKEVLPFIALFGVMVLPGVTVDAENAPRFDKGVDDVIRAPSQLYAERFNGIINDCFELGVF